MRIKWYVTTLLLLAVFFAGGCALTPSREDVSSAVPTSGPDVATVHFPAFELSVPEGWTERGNLCRLYEGDGVFLLICPALSGDAQASLQAQCEQTLAEQLELFYNTEYYAGQVSFDYTEYETDGPEQTRVGGTLHNGKTGDELRFCGVYRSSPACCYVYFRNSDATTDLGLLREVSHDSFRTF